MASIEERVIAVTAHVLEVDPVTVKSEHDFGADLGAESVQSVELSDEGFVFGSFVFGEFANVFAILGVADHLLKLFTDIVTQDT